MNLKTKKAFTLVELIVVITILAILGTIAFISLQGYSLSARNSVRKADLSLIKKSLELFQIKTSSYPRPDNEIAVSYSGGILYYQGYIGDNLLKNLSNISKKPIDPLFNIEYSYSVTKNGKDYQLGSSLEEGLYTNNNLGLTSSVNAISNNSLISYSISNYNLFDLVSKNNNNCINITIPSLNINNLPQDGILLNNGIYNFVYNNSIYLPMNYESIIDINRIGLSFNIKEVLNKCSIDTLNELNTYINLISTYYQAFNSIENYDELIFDSHNIYYKIKTIEKLRLNGISVSDDIIDEIYAVSPDNIFSDTFSGSDNIELIPSHIADSTGTWSFINPSSNSSSYLIFGNKLLKNETGLGAISPIPSLPITSNNYVLSFEIKDFSGGDINVYARYIDDNNYYGLKINQNGYQLLRKVGGITQTFGNVSENIPINSKIEFNLFGNNLVFLINNIEKENIIDNSIQNIGKVALELINQNSLIDNFIFKYK